MKISVIIPSYKPGAYLNECLESLKQQTLDSRSFEVILILNGCSEPWLGQIKEWQVQNNLTNFRLINVSEGGVSNARNIGIEESKGEYITFLDDDDYVSPEYLEELLKNASEDTIILSNTISFDEETGDFDESYYIQKVYNELRSTGNINLISARSYFNGPCMKLCHRDVIGGSRFDKKFKNGEDSLFMFDISRNIKQIKLSSSEAIYYRRIRNNSATTRKWGIAELFLLCGNSILAYTGILLKHPFQYNYKFYMTRVLASVKRSLEYYKQTRRKGL